MHDCARARAALCYSGLYCADPDEQFWAHEYNAHGTCNINDFNEVEYFNATLELNEAFPIDVSRQAYFPVMLRVNGNAVS